MTALCPGGLNSQRGAVTRAEIKEKFLIKSHNKHRLMYQMAVIRICLFQEIFSDKKKVMLMILNPLGVQLLFAFSAFGIGKKGIYCILS